MKKLFLSGFIVLGILASGCSDENNSPVQGPDGEELNGYVTLTLTNPPTMGSKTTGDPDTDTPLAGESKINNVTVAFVAEGDTKVKYLATPTITATTDGAKTEAFKIAIGKYDVYALANNASSIYIGAEIEQVIKAANADEIKGGFKDGSFFMTNARHTSNDTPKPAWYSFEITAAHNSVENAAQVKINVDRVAAKIIDVTATPSITGLKEECKDFVAGVEVIGFTPLNVNPQFNMLQTWGTANGNAAVSEEVLQTPFYTEKWTENFFYPITQYSEWTFNNDALESIADKTKDATDIFAYKGAEKPVYVTENRPIIGTFKDGWTSGERETTGVIYRVQAKDAAGANLPTFFSYRGIIYKTIAELEAIDEFAKVTPQVILTGRTNEQLRTLGIRVYEKGIMYYTKFIRNVNPDYPLGDGEYYGILRNSVYKLNIKSISKLGDDIPGGGIDPGEEPKNPGTTNPPIDVDETYIQVEVEVNPWILNEIDIEF